MCFLSTPYQTAFKTETITSAEVAVLLKTFNASEAISTTLFPCMTSSDPPTGTVAVFTKQQFTEERVKYTSVVIGEDVVFATNKLVMAAVVKAATVTRVDALVPTFFAT